eukprot:scaffold18973_cov66-Phaeocystis_antarctica.AAC.2
MTGAAEGQDDARVERVAQPLEDDAQRIVAEGKERHRGARACRGGGVPTMDIKRIDRNNSCTRSDRFAAKHQYAVPEVGMLGALAQHARRVAVVLVPALHEGADHGLRPLRVEKYHALRHARYTVLTTLPVIGSTRAPRRACWHGRCFVGRSPRTAWARARPPGQGQAWARGQAQAQGSVMVVTPRVSWPSRTAQWRSPWSRGPRNAPTHSK